MKDTPPPEDDIPIIVEDPEAVTEVIPDDELLIYDRRTWPPCPTCTLGETGAIGKVVIQHLNHLWVTEYQTIDCPTCDGKGAVPPPKKM